MMTNIIKISALTGKIALSIIAITGIIIFWTSPITVPTLIIMVLTGASLLQSLAWTGLILLIGGLIGF